MSEEQTILEQTKLIVDIQSYISEKAERDKKLPYHINVIEELHINENAHTRILAKLLQYNDNGNFPILKSFIKKFVNEKCKDNIKLDAIEYPLINVQDDYMDCTITEDNKYAIIIENKIYWAENQDQQIDRYISKIKERWFQNEYIFVIYITNNGEEKAGEDTLEKGKEVLDYKSTNDPGRFIAINYKTDIFPWLKKVLEECRKIEGQKLLTSALEQYYNYLKIMFENNQNEMYCIKNTIGLTSDMDLKTKIGIIDKYKENLTNFDNALKDCFDELIQHVELNKPKEKEERIKDQEFFKKVLDLCDSFGISKAYLQTKAINNNLVDKLENFAKNKDYGGFTISGVDDENIISYRGQKIDINIKFHPSNKNSDLCIWIRFISWGLTGMEWGIWSDKKDVILLDENNKKILNNSFNTNITDKYWVYGLISNKTYNDTDFSDWNNNDTFSKVIYTDEFINYLTKQFEEIFKVIDNTTLKVKPINNI